MKSRFILITVIMLLLTLFAGCKKETDNDFVTPGEVKAYMSEKEGNDKEGNDKEDNDKEDGGIDGKDKKNKDGMNSDTKENEDDASTDNDKVHVPNLSLGDDSESKTENKSSDKSDVSSAKTNDSDAANTATKPKRAGGTGGVSSGTGSSGSSNKSSGMGSSNSSGNTQEKSGSGSTELNTAGTTEFDASKYSNLEAAKLFNRLLTSDTIDFYDLNGARTYSASQSAFLGMKAAYYEMKNGDLTMLFVSTPDAPKNAGYMHALQAVNGDTLDLGAFDTINEVYPNAGVLVGSCSGGQYGDETYYYTLNSYGELTYSAMKAKNGSQTKYALYHSDGSAEWLKESEFNTWLSNATKGDSAMTGISWKSLDAVFE